MLITTGAASQEKNEGATRVGNKAKDEVEEITKYLLRGGIRRKWKKEKQWGGSRKRKTRKWKMKKKMTGTNSQVGLLRWLIFSGVDVAWKVKNEDKG
ncbi:hypothetical protein PAAG_05565 [Paracoccidioides lutzii Pb01]|uniref:Uncharacterized protein n=1 Tax=Paracoccidioides lutzii (strain ATCC MYA-826 / Pb01) TaxID=502779 RepID=C1H472_PARBA|nr:hypothetical protein PAAG_05565 [Paracoccidioides lutzii Pb01]EEH34516.2 hypothetical protein PAAG_05565 [Paracoccidioides lutzii Pb01]